MITFIDDKYLELFPDSGGTAEPSRKPLKAKLCDIPISDTGHNVKRE